MQLQIEPSRVAQSFFDAPKINLYSCINLGCSCELAVEHNPVWESKRRTRASNPLIILESTTFEFWFNTRRTGNFWSADLLISSDFPPSKNKRLSDIIQAETAKMKGLKWTKINKTGAGKLDVEVDGQTIPLITAIQLPRGYKLGIGEDVEFGMTPQHSFRRLVPYSPGHVEAATAHLKTVGELYLNTLINYHVCAGRLLTNPNYEITFF